MTFREANGGETLIYRAQLSNRDCPDDGTNCNWVATDRFFRRNYITREKARFLARYISKMLREIPLDLLMLFFAQIRHVLPARFLMLRELAFANKSMI